MTITAIKAQARNAERVSIYIDGKYSFSLTRSQLLEQKIHVGLELDEAQLGILKRAGDWGKMLERALNYALIRPHSVMELRDYLRRKQVVPEMSEDILQWLIERRYLDDVAFTRSWVRARELGKPVSRRRLVAELRQKGIKGELIEQVLGTETYNEPHALREIIAKKRKQSRYQDEQKLIAYLARQGFSYDAIREALRSDV